MRHSSKSHGCNFATAVFTGVGPDLVQIVVAEMVPGGRRSRRSYAVRCAQGAAGRAAGPEPVGEAEWDGCPAGVRRRPERRSSRQSFEFPHIRGGGGIRWLGGGESMIRPWRSQSLRIRSVVRRASSSMWPCTNLSKSWPSPPGNRRLESRSGNTRATCCPALNRTAWGSGPEPVAECMAFTRARAKISSGRPR